MAARVAVPLLALLSMAAATPQQQHRRRAQNTDGPGAGPWQSRNPRELDLDGEKLNEAAQYLNAEMGGRRCFLVIYQGFIVKEQYYLGHQPESLYPAFSVTKSLCSIMYGMAVQQGWAQVHDLIAERNSGTRECNTEANFEHVLTMTGRSLDLEDPVFEYDASGRACLDALADFIDENNPDELPASEWKDQYFKEALGWEHSDWADEFRCGSSVQASCRDLGRAAQLWANDGFWPDAGQLMDEQYSRDGSTMIFPDSGAAYGYTHWLNPLDEIDPEITAFIGANSQCVFVSKKERSIVISMGNGDNSDCRGATDERNFLPWATVRDIVSKPNYANASVV